MISAFKKDSINYSELHFLDSFRFIEALLCNIIKTMCGKSAGVVVKRRILRTKTKTKKQF